MQLLSVFNMFAFLWFRQWICRESSVFCRELTVISSIFWPWKIWQPGVLLTSMKSIRVSLLHYCYIIV